MYTYVYIYMYIMGSRQILAGPAGAGFEWGSFGFVKNEHVYKICLSGTNKDYTKSLLLLDEPMKLPDRIT